MVLWIETELGWVELIDETGFCGFILSGGCSIVKYM